MDFESTKLNRHELPLQSVRERNEDLTATVPIHLSILKLPALVRSDKSIIAGIRENVSEFYNADMAYYLGVLDAATWICHGLNVT